VLVQAYQRLGYDLVVLSPDEEKLLRRAGATIPDNWITAGPRTGMVDLEKAGLRIGVVIFPLLDPPVDKPPGVLMRQVEDKARRLRERSDLVVGISTWGGMAEKRFLKQTGPVLDILLGSGPGPGLAGGLFADKRTFWTRPVSRGKTVSAVGLAEMPRPGEDWQWVKEKNIHLLHRPLDDAQPPDASMDALFDNFPKDTHK